MKRTKFSDEQIIKALKRQAPGEKSVDLCRDLDISQATFYKWKAKFGGMDDSEAQKMRAMDEENRRLKRLVADLSLDTQVLQ